jgi:hypothetical protein
MSKTLADLCVYLGVELARYGICDGDLSVTTEFLRSRGVPMGLLVAALGTQARCDCEVYSLLCERSARVLH